jgi:hypothetical protein
MTTTNNILPPGVCTAWQRLIFASIRSTSISKVGGRSSPVRANYS